MIPLEKIRIGNAAGTVKHYAEFERLCKTAATDVTLGSITDFSRKGNFGDVYAFDDENKTAINALGLPNPGRLNYWVSFPLFRDHAALLNKNFRVSVAGFSAKEYAQLVTDCLEFSVPSIELNLGCPNVWGAGGQKPIASYDPALSEHILSAVIKAGVFDGGKGLLYPLERLADEKVPGAKISVKISPVEDEGKLRELAKVIEESSIVSEVVAVNTLPNQRLTINGKEALRFYSEEDPEIRHVGGLSGAPLLKHGLRVAESMRKHLPDRIDIIGCGGIFTGADAYQYLERGCVGVQLAAAYIQRREPIFSEILTGLSDLVPE